MQGNGGTEYWFNGGNEDFQEQEQWEDEEFDEKVSHASSRMNESTYGPGWDSRYERDAGAGEQFYEQK